QELIDAFRSQHRKQPQIDAAETEMRQWYLLASQVTDTILGHSSYQRVERFRDREPGITARFLEQRGLPEDFLQRIPPLRTGFQTRTSLTAIREAIIR
ncbi:MAG: hypothetical protein JJ992_23540, partial [Planctomycetes bacterium]|nr:hypothetical protein [Planctomycetota bacterium]